MTPIIAYELRWRIQGSGQAWTTQRYGPETTTIVINGLIRGQTYDGEARAIGANGVPSGWAPITWEVSETHREGTAALPPVAAGNVSSRWVSGTEITWSATDTTCTINVSAGVLQMGERQFNYNASSLEISDGTAEESRTLYLYYDDPNLDAGTRTLGATTDPVASMSAHGRVLIDQVTIVFDVSGGTGATGGGDIGGSGGGSGGTCPWEGAWMLRKSAEGPLPAQAGAIVVGDDVRLTDGRYGRVSARSRVRARMVRVFFGDGHSLTCSRTAQLERAGGGYVLATACVGSRMTYWAGDERKTATVSRIEDAGLGWVIELTVEKSAFLVGDDPGHLLGHHNIKADSGP